MSACPHCGGALDVPAKHRAELERQLGDVSAADALRQRAVRANRTDPAPKRLSDKFIAWRGYVWAPCRLRKAATCVASGVTIRAGGAAWRQLSDVRDRHLRVSEYAWRDL